MREILVRYSFTPRRFPRFAFGHEFFQTFRHNIDPDYIDIRIRAALERAIRVQADEWEPDRDLDWVAAEILASRERFDVVG